MENPDFVPLLILKYWFYMVRFVSKTIIKTKREKNHSIVENSSRGATHAAPVGGVFFCVGETRCGVFSS